jgi:hypothetical protein
MGGLISLYALLQRGAVFGGAGVMSAALWYGQGRIFDVVTTASPAGRVYVDVGMHEGAGTLRNARRLARLLTRRGCGGRTDCFVTWKMRAAATRKPTGRGVCRRAGVFCCSNLASQKSDVRGQTTWTRRLSAQEA